MSLLAELMRKITMEKCSLIVRIWKHCRMILFIRNWNVTLYAAYMLQSAIDMYQCISTDG